MDAKRVWIVPFVIAALLTACGGSATPLPVPVTGTESAPAESPATSAPGPSPTPPPAVQPTDGQRVEFDSEDGMKLVGYYYPAAIPNAPLVVLMHWANGDQRDWTRVGLVQWLQNRGMENPNPGIYEPMPEGLSFAVFTFDFRGFGESPGKSTFDRPGFLKDARAAVQFARTLSGVDPDRVATIGSSIGADGAVDGCLEGCLGALSLSHGNYLTRPYAEAVQAAGKAGKPAWCLAAEGDGEAAPTCKGASGTRYFMKIYPGSAHGTRLLMKGSAPEDIGQMILDWLKETYGF
jgi:dienelactone hydrolase